MVIKSRVRAPDWSANGNPDREAKCRKFPLPTNHEVDAYTDPFFYDQEEAAHVCNGTYDDYVCPFRDSCLYGALVNNESDGTFGGFTTAQRKWIRRQNRDPESPTYIPRDSWEWPEEWRDLVPTVEELQEEESDDDEVEAEESA